MQTDNAAIMSLKLSSNRPHHPLASLDAEAGPVKLLPWHLPVDKEIFSSTIAAKVAEATTKSNANE